MGSAASVVPPQLARSVVISNLPVRNRVSRNGDEPTRTGRPCETTKPQCTANGHASSATSGIRTAETKLELLAFAFQPRPSHRPRSADCSQFHRAAGSRPCLLRE